MVKAVALRFNIRTADGPSQELIVDSDTARLGSGAQCEIRLASHEAAVEQLLIRARSGGVFGEVRSMEPPILLNGAPFVQGRLLPESVLKLGGVEFTVGLLDRQLEAGSRPGRQHASSRVAYGIIAVAASVVIVFAIMATKREANPDVAAVPPALWSKEQTPECSQSDASSAAALAEKYRLQAESARERAPFSPQDGVLAVGLFAQAAACYSVAEAAAAAVESRRAADVLKQQLEREFHVHSVRLERALATQSYDRARTEVRVLLSFGARRAEPYFGWLSTLERQIELKFLGKKS